MLTGHEGLEGANANLMGLVTLEWDDEQTTRDALLEKMAKAGFHRIARCLTGKPCFPVGPLLPGRHCCAEQARLRDVLSRAAQRESDGPRGVQILKMTAGTLARMAEAPSNAAGPDAARLATEARDRVRFEEEALGLSDQVYRVARHLASSREEADDLVQETYARAFRSWRSYTPGTNLRAWLLRILTNLNIDRGRRKQRAPQMQPLEANDYYLYDKLAESDGGRATRRRSSSGSRRTTSSRRSPRCRTTSAT